MAPGLSAPMLRRDIGLSSLLGIMTRNLPRACHVALWTEALRDARVSILAVALAWLLVAIVLLLT